MTNALNTLLDMFLCSEVVVKVDGATRFHSGFHPRRSEYARLDRLAAISSWLRGDSAGKREDTSPCSRRQELRSSRYREFLVCSAHILNSIVAEETQSFRSLGIRCHA